MVSYFEYVKERWTNIFLLLKSVYPVMLLFGFMVPLLISLFVWPIWYDLALYLTCIGFIWFVLAIVYFVYDNEKDNYKVWKENYSFNHRDQTNSKDETQREE